MKNEKIYVLSDNKKVYKNVHLSLYLTYFIRISFFLSKRESSENISFYKSNFYEIYYLKFIRLVQSSCNFCIRFFNAFRLEYKQIYLKIYRNVLQTGFKAWIISFIPLLVRNKRIPLEAKYTWFNICNKKTKWPAQMILTFVSSNEIWIPSAFSKKRLITIISFCTKFEFRQLTIFTTVLLYKKSIYFLKNSMLLHTTNRL